MKIFLSLLVLTACISCGDSSAISKKLAGTDSLVITFNEPNSDVVRNMVNTTDKKAIRKVIRFMNGKNTAQYKCGYDGNMIFYEKGTQLMPVVFKFSGDSCRNFLFDIDNVLISAPMGKEATSFFESLSSGKNWY